MPSSWGNQVRTVPVLLALILALAACAPRARMEGIVLRVDRPAQSMLVSHRAVKGVMPAMVMPFRVANPGEFASLAPGARIEFQFRKQAAYRIRVLDARRTPDFDFPRSADELKPGEAVPDFALIDQMGRPFTIQSLRGRVGVVNFLYTRCPFPEVCPRQAASFASLQRRFAGQIPAGLVLLSITLDPTFDTPKVLSSYAATMKARPEGWFFLTGETTPIAKRFGLAHWVEEGVIVHNSQTAVLDREGRLVAMVEGSSYRLEQLADLVKHALDSARQ